MVWQEDEHRAASASGAGKSAPAFETSYAATLLSNIDLRSVKYPYMSHNSGGSQSVSDERVRLAQPPEEVKMHPDVDVTESLLPPVISQSLQSSMVNTKSENIIITGGARGIGRATARYLLAQPLSHRVFFVDLDGDELEYAATKHLSAYAPRVGYSTANLRSQQDICEAVAEAAKFFGGRIDVLVNNTGTTVRLGNMQVHEVADLSGIARAFFTAGNGTMEDIATVEQWQAYIDTNLSAPFWMSQAVISFMKAQNPKIEGKGQTEQEGVDREEDVKR